MTTATGLSREEESFDDTARSALLAADPTALLATLFSLTGDEGLLEISACGSEPALFGEMPAIVDAVEQARLRERALEVLRAIHAGTFESEEPTPDRLERSIDLCVGERVPESLIGACLEEAGFRSRRLEWDRPPSQEALASYHVVVIGAGMGGIMAAVRLKEMGLPYTVFEKNAGVGGTWHANHYPGARVDVPSQVYSYPWVMGYRWKHIFAPQAEIREYLSHVAEKHGVLRDVKLETEVVAARWDEHKKLWNVEVRSNGGSIQSVQANAIISAVGLLDRPSTPAIAGLDTFKGSVVHTAQWDDQLDLRGRRVGIIGTGASGIQLAPAIAADVEHLTVFQRTPAWVVPVEGYHDPVPWQVNWLREQLPQYESWLRLRITYGFMDKFHSVYDVDPDWDRSQGSLGPQSDLIRQRCSEHRERQLEDWPDLLEECTPDYPPMVIRIVLDSGWFEMLKRDNVTLCTDGIAEVTPDGIRTDAGDEVPLDVIVLATGFHANRFLWPMTIEGVGGQTLEDAWKPDGGRAYLGINVPGFPNLYCVYGPNTNPSSGSPFMHDELEIRYALGCIKSMIEGGHRSMDLRKDVFDAFQEKLDDQLSRMVWMDPSAKSYYRNEHGRVAVWSPWLMKDYWRWTLKPDLEEYHLD